MKSLSTALLLALAMQSSAQLPAIGHWRSHVPYRNPIAVVDGGDEVFVANTLSVFSYAKEDGAIKRYSKVNLLSDIGVRDLFYNDQRDALIIDYVNSNIDVLSEGLIFNFPFIRNQNIVGDKGVYHASFLGDTAFLSCGFGIVVLDLEKRESPATYFFEDDAGTPIRVNSTAAFGDRLFAASPDGLYFGDLSNPLLENFSSWQLEDPSSGLPSGEVDKLFSWNDDLYALVDTLIYQNDGAGWLPWYAEAGWLTVDAQVADDRLLLTQHLGSGQPPAQVRIQVFDDAGLAQTIEEEYMPFPMQADVDEQNRFWIADLYRGLFRYQSTEDFSIVEPNGPFSNKVSNMAPSPTGEIFVAPGEVNGSWNKLYNKDGFFRFDQYGWSNRNEFTTPGMDSVLDILAVTVDPGSGTAWMGSYGSGLLEFKVDGSLVQYKQGTGLQGAVGDETNFRVAGVALDPNNGRLWMANFAAPQPVVVRTKNNDWYSFSSGLPSSVVEQLAGSLVDDFGQVWFVLARGNGILVYDPGQDLASPSDDRRKQLGLGAGNGNLHTTEVLCMAKDRDGEVWVGTEEGISVFYNPGAVLEPGTAGDAAQIFVELGEFGAFLLEEEFIRDIVVDGGNRKWIATDNGVFLVSEDGTDELLHFTTDNSPLLDNAVRSIAINEITGEVFIGTVKGIISYRGEATSGSPTHSDVIVFPNPVRENYNGPIAIRGLATDAEVKITDVSGKLVYETVALGGQAVWDGRRVEDGKRASTGVYLVFSASPDGEDKFVAKFLMVN